VVPLEAALAFHHFALDLYHTDTIHVMLGVTRTQNILKAAAFKGGNRFMISNHV
jgi:hypothetical protein